MSLPALSMYWALTHPRLCLKYSTYMISLIITAILWIAAITILIFYMRKLEKEMWQRWVDSSHVTQLVKGGPRCKPRQSGWGSQALNHDTYCLLNKLVTINPLLNFSFWVESFLWHNGSICNRSKKNVRFLVMHGRVRPLLTIPLTWFSGLPNIARSGVRKLQSQSELPPVFVSQVLLGHSHVHLLLCCLWLLLLSNHTVE